MDRCGPSWHQEEAEAAGPRCSAAPGPQQSTDGAVLGGMGLHQGGFCQGKEGPGSLTTPYQSQSQQEVPARASWAALRHIWEMYLVSPAAIL